ncbi:dipeptide/oligopeptide/nickel ABC transporter ATP-binding protein [Streptomyces sp. TSRI0384-2]|nr:MULTISPECIES: ABC transporter ATP-binding protein [unclassified Streptomyces]MBL3804271.1 ABC transporter ATP-binding protein [Streptomyces sp. BRB081]NEE29719.1 ABC transporter ATP-binding protein [Streptomyces sp. SID7982]NEE49751.1 ABC transporter ATP-binding protein [Streptomyces sp. SID8455]WSU39463.1 ABC transporter ATP-binding protein [Streptomyces gougerotii]GFH67810.1 dipeptide/oligopeptide/nickel ABC transporter ATP-binding protein [Streptomyces rutgersensis]
MPLLSVDELSITFTGRGRRDVRAVDGVSFDVDQGQVVGLVGESGCGKSVTSLALMGLLPKKGVKLGGRAEYDGKDLLTLSPNAMRDMRGKHLAMIFQDPLSSLNPVIPVGLQVTEILERHRGMKGAAARKEAADLLDRVGIPDPTRRLKEYPHQLSGGMRQRALIAMAVACAPRMLIADEPTTALDVTIQAQILELLKELVDQQGTALLMITHDLGVVAGLCDQVNVLYAGKAVESAGRRELFAQPTHPYAHGLLGSIPRLDAPRGEPLRPIRGSINDRIDWADGCAFAPRCDHYTLECLSGTPRLTEPVGAGHGVRCVNPVLTGVEVKSLGVPAEQAVDAEAATEPAEPAEPAEPKIPAQAAPGTAEKAEPAAAEEKAEPVESDGPADGPEAKPAPEAKPEAEKKKDAS